MTLYIYLILNIAMSYCLLHSLYERIYAGKFIIKIRQKKILIIWSIALIAYLCILGLSLKNYLRGDSIRVDGILNEVFFIQIAISDILNKSALGITKGGIYSGDSKYSTFTKWNKIKNCAWLSDDTLQIESITRKNKTLTTELKLNLEQKEEVNIILREKLNDKHELISAKKNLILRTAVILVAILIIIGHVNLVKISKPYMAQKINIKKNEAEAVLKKTWKPLVELDKQDIKSKEDFDNVFKETMTEHMIYQLYTSLTNKFKSTEEEIIFQENTKVPTIYDKNMFVEKSYIKAQKYKNKNKEVILEKLIIEEVGRDEEDEELERFKRESTFIKNNNDEWILDSITGVQSIQSQ